MRRFLIRSFSVALVLTAAIVGIGIQSAVAERGGTPPSGAPAYGARDVCAPPGNPTLASCTAKVVTQADGVTPLATGTYQNGLRPADLASAYKLPTGGSGSIVAIVDAYANPSAYSDVNAYRSQFGIPSIPKCPTSAAAAGCFEAVNQNGGSSLPSSDVGWGQEIDLDIEMVSAVCPNCGILLVEANSNSFGDLGAAVNRAATMGATAISNSYGTNGEFSGETSYDGYYNHRGIAVTASSGDSGYGVEYPAASQYVVSVGGTSLSPDSSTRGWSETAWSGAGSGCSSQESRPSWQTSTIDPACSRRTVADVSAVADPNTGVAVYDSYGSNGANWYVFGGTSVASPIIASVYGLAGNAGSFLYPASNLYSHTGSLFDVTSGSNGNCSGHGRFKTSTGAYLCTAVTGYDGPTGLGTPNGTGAF
jgi:subtilase family serine protease